MHYLIFFVWCSNEVLMHITEYDYRAKVLKKVKIKKLSMYDKRMH